MPNLFSKTLIVAGLSFLQNVIIEIIEYYEQLRIGNWHPNGHYCVKAQAKTTKFFLFPMYVSMH